MVPDAVLGYLLATTVLFFFWVYGIVSFALDLKNTIIPGVRRYLRGRRAQKAAAERQEERERRERQLH